MRLTIDSGQHKDKSDYYHSFKIRLKVNSRVKLGSRVRRVNLVDLIKHKIKTVIIIVLKLDSIVKTETKPKLQIRRVNLGQCKHKNYYYSFKTRLDGRSGQGLGHGSGWVDPSQRMDKNNYYHSFKTRLKKRT